ncbi:type I restriction enzyme HsdR N-terminal domain-containing protein [Quatrionicoccus australiensis]|uniref:type I restriction enzyme HsdR N-terminal domain-containing protein n=1 Tax=Quatrionicoccus australiensis TaxID=138118 RepID=UPI001CF824E5|nr:type I restriction enzyme HsdR N-terminal domain-containing protein [Quatrionicoccus australiensis]UCV15477.1 type I restriction enzyme HsdR N-terminal domain-containing protein [Quatrionicoccus australiensis]
MIINAWGKLAGAAAADEATVELQLVLPLLELLGYVKEDIAPKHSVIFQQGRRGRPHEADFAIFNGGGRSKDNALLVVEAKKAGESLADARQQAESYAANLGAPLLLCTNGETIEVWQMQPAGTSKCVVVGQVLDVLSLQSKLEVVLRKEAAIEYKRQIQHPSLVDKGPDLSDYLKQQLEAFKDHGIERRLKFGQSTIVMSGELLSQYARGCIVEGPSGFGKSTLAASLMNKLVLEHAQTRKIPIHVWLPDAFRPGIYFRGFLVDRIRSHCPAVVESVLLEAFRANGGWLVLDGMERLSEESVEALSTELRLLQQDFPRLGGVVLGRRQRLADSVLPVLTLCELNEEEQRQVAMLTFNNEGLCSSFFGLMPSSFRRLTGVPLLLVRFAKGYAESGRIPLRAEELFSDWLTLLLSKGGSRPSSQVTMFTRAMDEVAWMTRAGPIRSEDAIHAIEAAGIAASAFDELVSLGAIAGNQCAVELIHEALADYLRVRRALSSRTLLEVELEKLNETSDGFFPILLAALAPDKEVARLIWQALRHCNLDVILQCVRFNAAMGPDSKTTNLDEASEEVVQEFAWSLDCFLDRFPALRSSVIGLLSGSQGKEGFRLIGALEGHVSALSWQVQPIESGYEYQARSAERSFRILHGSNIDIHESRDRGMLLGAEHTLKSLLELAQHRRLQGGSIYVEERLLSRLQCLELEERGIPLCGYRFDDIFRWLAPHRGEVVGSPFGRQFLIDEVLTDVQFLRSLGQSSVSAWWWDYLDPMSMVPRDDSAVVAYFKEKYKRIVFGYREVCEASLAGHLQNLGMYRALPMRWRVVVARGADGRSFRTDATWRPVQNWGEVECDVELVEEIEYNWSNDDELIHGLVELGRYAGRHLLIGAGNFAVQFVQSNAYKASAGESVVLTEISDWIAKDIDSLFREFGRPS